MIGTSWKMALFKCFIYGAKFSCYKIMMMMMITVKIIMKIIITIINRSEDLKLRNAGINQWSSIQTFTMLKKY